MDEAVDGDGGGEAAEDGGSSRRFSDLAKPTTSESRASQFTGVEYMSSSSLVPHPGPEKRREEKKKQRRGGPDDDGLFCSRCSSR